MAWKTLCIVAAVVISTTAYRNSMQSSNSEFNKQKRDAANPKITFPDENTNVSFRFGAGGFEIQESDVPEECRELGLCENVPQYPEAIAKEILKNIPDAKVMNKDELDVKLEQRFSAGDDVESLCNVVEKVVKPRLGRDRSKNFRYVLNPDDAAVQLFRVEICTKKDAACQFVSGEGSWRPFCKQTYSYRNMVVITGPNEYKWELIQIPTCCVCAVKQS